MKVSELIEQLKELDPDLPVWHDGGGDPYCAGSVRRVEVVTNGGAPPGMKMMGSDRPETMVELS